MGATPYYTSQDLVSAVQRKISMPLSQNTFSSDDLLAFANEEMMISLCPQLLTYHEEYFVFLQVLSLNPNQLAYPIPERAIGMRLRSVFYVDPNGNRFEMVRVNPDDKSFFQYTNGNNESAFRYYLQGNDIILTPNSLPSPIGFLEFGYYLRPNQLVDNSRAAIIQNFLQTIQCVNSNIVAGDTITIFNNLNSQSIVLTAVSGAPSTNQFQIGATSINTATNLATAIVATGLVVSAGNGSPQTDTVSINYNNIQLIYSASNTAGFIIPSTLSIVFDSVPSNITSSSKIDFLQTGGGHRTYAISVPIVNLSANVISVNPVLIPNLLIGINNTPSSLFNPTLLFTNMQPGDYVCEENECIIPQVPSDLHTGLAERTCARILSAIGDQQGLQATMAKVQEIQNAQSPLLGARVDGDGKKIFPRKTLLRYGKFINYRRF